MIEELPPPCTRLLFGVGTHATVTEMTHCSGGPAFVRQFNLPSFSSVHTGGKVAERLDATTWAELPAADDPRWRSYTDYKDRPAPDQAVLVFGKSWFNHRATYTKPWSEDDRYVAVDTPVVKNDCFLGGFAGGPQTRDWGILKWMPLDEAFRDAKAIPADFLAKKTAWQYQRAERQLVVEQEAENIYLTVINDGHCYRNLLGPMCKIGPKAVNNFLGLRTAVSAAINYLVRKGELDQDWNVWDDAKKIAMEQIIEYYRNHAKELVA
jgi:hypothetical protein